MKNEKITIYDIAKEAGVSTATVSRILSGKNNVSHEKREKVLSLIEKHGFVPNALAQGLTTKESKTIGMLLSDIRNPFYASLHVGAETAAIREGYTVILCNSLNDDEVERQNLEMLVRKGVDVIFLSGGRVDTITPDEEQVKLMSKIAETTPLVVAGTADYFPCSRIGIDDRPGMEALMGYLIGLGHKRFALLGGTSIKSPTYKKQVLFQEILERNGLTYHPQWVIETEHYDVSDGYAAAKRLLRQHNLPTAILGINELTAVGAMRAITEAGYSIPEDFSVAGFDNTYLAEISSPTLTSAGCMYDEYGEELIDLVIQAAAKPGLYKNKNVPSGVTVRKSCAAPRKK